MICCKPEYERKILSIVNNLEDLTEFQKKIITKRYVKEVNLYSKRTHDYGCLYYILNLIVTIGSILLPALLAIQNNENYREQIYWVAWIISLIITISNGIIQLFSVNNNYLIHNHVKEQLISEGWKYFQLSGTYQNLTHGTAFKMFCIKIEEIKSKQVKKELEFINPESKDDDDKSSINTPINTNLNNTNLNNTNLNNDINLNTLNNDVIISESTL